MPTGAAGSDCGEDGEAGDATVADSTAANCIGACANRGAWQTHQLLAPRVELARADPVFPGDLSGGQVRSKALGDDLALLLGCPRTPRFSPGENLDAGRTSTPMITHTSALSVLDQVRRHHVHAPIGSWRAHDPPDVAAAPLTVAHAAHPVRCQTWVWYHGMQLDHRLAIEGQRRDKKQRQRVTGPLRSTSITGLPARRVSASATPRVSTIARESEFCSCDGGAGYDHPEAAMASGVRSAVSLTADEVN